MENKPPRVQNFNNLAFLFVVSISGLFNNEITTTPNGISTVKISETP
jgi:hypothetical protein